MTGSTHGTSAHGTPGKGTSGKGTPGKGTSGAGGVGGRLAARAAGGAMRVFLVLVGLFWLMPTVGLLLSYELLLQQTNNGARGGPGVLTVHPSAVEPLDGGNER